MMHGNTAVRRALAALAFSVLAITCSSEADHETPAAGGSSADAGSSPAGAGGSAIGSGGVPSGAVSNDAGSTRIVLTDANNYAFSSRLSATTTRIRANSDISFDWSEVTIDMLGNEMDPFTSVDMMQVMLWRYDEDSFLASINDEALETGRLVAMGYCDTDNARDGCRLFDLVAPSGGPIAQEKLLQYVNPETYPPTEHVWVVMLATGNVFGQGTRLLAFFQPTEDETETEVRLSNDSSTLSHTVALTELTPISVPPHTGELLVSWADDDQLSTNAMGADWVPTRITDVAIAHYAGYTVSDLEQRFLQLRELASEYYGLRLNVGQEVQLSELADEDRNPFAGIDDSGVWLLSLICGGCRNPAPWFLSILQPTPRTRSDTTSWVNGSGAALTPSTFLGNRGPASTTGNMTSAGPPPSAAAAAGRPTTTSSTAATVTRGAGTPSAATNEPTRTSCSGFAVAPDMCLGARLVSAGQQAQQILR